MLDKDHWAVKATKKTAAGLYVLGMLAAITVLFITGLIAMLSPHQDFWSALDLLTEFRSHDVMWLVLLLLGTALTAADIFFRCKGVYAKD